MAERPLKHEESDSRVCPVTRAVSSVSAHTHALEGLPGSGTSKTACEPDASLETVHICPVDASITVSGRSSTAALALPCVSSWDMKHFTSTTHKPWTFQSLSEQTGKFP